ncbi:Wzz/FepE/Etk N-terminal domain-containing protein [Pseudomonadales bacterium]|nr:Wzz/FepE/Etk N-terminal domain-containing protein [Pseudomonadales bacterium]
METKAQAPVDQNIDDEINLNELFAVLWAGKFQILVCVLLSALVSVSVALYLPNKYTAEAVLAPRSSGGGGGLAQLASQYGGLASLAGISFGEGDSAAVAGEMIKTREFFSAYLYDSVLVELMAAESWDRDTDSVTIDDRLFDVQSQTWIREVAPPFQVKPSAQEAHEAFVEEFLRVSEDKQTGFVTIAITHLSPSVARDWVSLLVEGINEAVRARDVREAENSIEFLNEQRLKTNLVSLTEVFSELIEEQTKTVMLANASDEYVFQVIEPPVAPERKSEPSRALICVLGTMLGGMLGLLLVLIRHYASKSGGAE